MSVGFTFSAASLFYIILLAGVYFSKKRVNNIENKIYSWLIISNLIGVFLALGSYYTISNIDTMPFITYVVSKALLLYYLVWASLFTVYVFVVSYNDKNKTEEERYKNYKKYVKRFSILFVIISLCVLVLPLKFHNEGGVVYSYGASANLLYVVIPLYICSFFVCMMKNLKSLKNRKYLPLFFFTLIGTIVTIVQKMNPGLLLMTAMETFITFLMYFTIENPDVKMIGELNENRRLVVKTLEEKSNFLFLTSNQIKNPINDILKISSNTLNADNIDVFKENMKEINNLSHSLAFVVENVMDISTLSIKNIKVINNRYNLNNLITKIKLLKEKEISDNVEFRVNISENIPKYLYGDSKLLEQVISSILDNSIKYTEEGFIELNINTIQKYDMCRLIITVEDSGVGISIDKVNDLLMIDEPLSNEEIESLETKVVNINAIKKIVAKLGGYFTIKSEENHGTEIKIVVDQRIDDVNIIKLDKYSNKQNVLIASNDTEFLKNITRLIEKKDYNVENSIYANNIFDRLRNGEKFEYILIDDNLDIRAYEILKELKKDKKFKINVIVMLDKESEFVKEHFVKDGFSDYLIKRDLPNEVNRIFK